MHQSTRLALIAAIAMLMTSMFGVALAGADSVQGSTTPATYDLIYIEVAPKDVPRTVALLRTAEKSARQGVGNIEFLALQRHPESNQFLIVGLWTNYTSFAAYQNSQRTKQFRTALQPWLIGPYDERPNIDFLSSSARDRAALMVVPENTLFVFAHIDIDPEKKAVGARAIVAMFLQSQHESGNLVFGVLNQASRTNHFTLFEAWQSQAFFSAYKEQKSVMSFRETLLPIMGSIYEERLYQKID